MWRQTRQNLLPEEDVLDDLDDDDADPTIPGDLWFRARILAPGRPGRGGPPESASYTPRWPRA